MTELEQVARSLQTLAKEVADSRAAILSQLSTLNEKVRRLPDLCNQHSESIAVLENQADWALPEHALFDNRLKSLERWRAWALGAAAGAGLIAGSAGTWLLSNLFRSL